MAAVVAEVVLGAVAMTVGAASLEVEDMGAASLEVENQCREEEAEQNHPPR